MWPHFGFAARYHLGVHSLAICIVVYILATNYQRLRNYPIWQQSFIVGLLSAFYHLVLFWLQHMLSDIYFLMHYLAPTLINMVAWIYVFYCCVKFAAHQGTLICRNWYFASQSPRRKELLAQLEDQFSVVAPAIDETPHDNESPRDYVAFSPTKSRSRFIIIWG